MNAKTHKVKSEDAMTVFNRKIAKLENEVGFAAFPYTRASYIREKLGVNEKDANPQKLDEALGGWLAFLSMIKYHKDNNSQVWARLRNWD